MDMEKTREALLKSLKEEISDELYRLLDGEKSTEKVLVVCALMRESLPLLSPEELKSLLRKNFPGIIAEIFRIRNTLAGDGLMRRERRLVLAAATRFFGTLERKTTRENLRMAENFWNEVCEAAMSIIEEKKKKSDPVNRSFSFRGRENDRDASPQRE